MEYIITTDTHFEHKNILDFGGRPEGFEQKIIDNLEKYANHTNTLIHLGDMAWKNDRFWNRQLTSMPFKKKWLIRGNHDKKSNEWYLSNGWDFVGEYLAINYKGTIFSFSHKPTELGIADINIHGHFHDIPLKRIQEIEPDLYTIFNQPGHVLLALENHYKPFELEQIEGVLQLDKEYQSNDKT